MPSWTGVRRQLRALHEPAPMNDYVDFDEYWEQRDEVGLLDRHMHRWDLAAERIPNGAHVLDVGCGGGDFLEFLRSVRPDIVGTGADTSPKARELTAARGFPVLDLDPMSEDLPEVDVVTCFEVLEHLPEAEVAIQHLCAAARRSVLLSMPNVGFIGSRVRLGLFGRFPNTNCVFHVKEHLRHWTPRDFQEWTERLGLDLVAAQGQYGVKPLWKRWPSLWAGGMFYEVAGTATAR